MTATAKKRSKAAQKAAQLARAELHKVVFNLPNQITWMRLLLTIIMFGLIAYKFYWAAMWLFIVAASTDWLDGYFARKWNQVTTLGRILDPFADKVIICGTFIYLAAIPEFNGAAKDHYPYLWPSMAVIVVGREILVTALRSFIEQQGSDFSANLSGKLKMVVQCFAAGAGLFYLDYIASPDHNAQQTPLWLHATLLASIWSAMLLTVYSGVGYIVTAVRLLRA
jgi:CDP-diacylglycerol--glycerol-3-phosphate 3-phosphatidyltransferase